MAGANGTDRDLERHTPLGEDVLRAEGVGADGSGRSLGRAGGSRDEGPHSHAVSSRAHDLPVLAVLELVGQR